MACRVGSIDSFDAVSETFTSYLHRLKYSLSQQMKLASRLMMLERQRKVLLIMVERLLA